MLLLQLSSISGGWVNIGLSVAENPQISAEMTGVAAALALIATPAAIAYAKADPHWNALREKHHCDAGLDEGCERILRARGLTDKQIADLNNGTVESRELYRHVLTSKFNPMQIVARLKREDTRQVATA